MRTTYVRTRALGRPARLTARRRDAHAHVQMATPRTPESGVSRVDTRLVLGSQLERPAVLSELAVERSVQEALLDREVSFIPAPQSYP